MGSHLWTATPFSKMRESVGVLMIPDELHLAYFFRLLSETTHSTSSSLQLVHGAPCSTTLQRTFLALQHWQAFEALRLTLFVGRVPFAFRPASPADLFWEDALGICGSGVAESDGVDDSDMAASIPIEPMFAY